MESGTPVVVDARGARCPRPVLDLARRIAAEPDGTEIVLLATDPAAETDVAAFCRMRGHAVVGVERHPDHTAYRVVTTGSRPPAAGPGEPGPGG